MARCDMCGSESYLQTTLIEETELNVCKICSKFGKVIRKERPKETIRFEKRVITQEAQEAVETVVQGYGKLIKDAREKLNLKQDEFARKINEKTSLIHNIESEHRAPDIKLAKKIDKFLNLNLVIEEKAQDLKLDKVDSGALTIGDLIKIKKR